MQFLCEARIADAADRLEAVYEDLASGRKSCKVNRAVLETVRGLLLDVPHIASRYADGVFNYIGLPQDADAETEPASVPCVGAVSVVLHTVDGLLERIGKRRPPVDFTGTRRVSTMGHVSIEAQVPIAILRGVVSKLRVCGRGLACALSSMSAMCAEGVECDEVAEAAVVVVHPRTVDK